MRKGEIFFENLNFRKLNPKATSPLLVDHPSQLAQPRGGLACPYESHHGSGDSFFSRHFGGVFHIFFANITFDQYTVYVSGSDYVKTNYSGNDVRFVINSFKL